MRHMTQILILMAVSIGAGDALAVPGQVQTQGVLRDAGGALLADGPLDITFRLYADGGGVTLLWSEPQTVAVVGGVFSARLPQDPVAMGLSAEAEAVIAVGGELWLSIQADGQAELPPTPLVSVPYAFTADRALVAASLACDGCIGPEALDASALQAATMSYDDSQSSLGASTVQEAIEALADATPVGGGGGGAITVYSGQGALIGKFLGVDDSVPQAGDSRCEGLVYLPNGAKIGDANSDTLDAADCRAALEGNGVVHFKDAACTMPTFSPVSAAGTFRVIDFGAEVKSYGCTPQTFTGVFHPPPSGNCPTFLTSDDSSGEYYTRWYCRLYTHHPTLGCQQVSMLWHWENGYGTQSTGQTLTNCYDEATPLCGGAPCYAQ